ncbi:hypothetical protein N0V90_007341 [Kalmusia sp. IMI 367209]|nr:hypothetical protein N0V90_007341 [Kalmusia sp. IMI 367209]
MPRPDGGAGTQDQEDLHRLRALAEDAVERGNDNPQGEKRKDHPLSDDERQPKTPRLSRPETNLAFDSNVPYTPDTAGRTLE